MAITKSVPRQDIEPGMLVEYRGTTYRASVNNNTHLYLHSIWNITRIDDAFISVLIDPKGRPQFSPN